LKFRFVELGALSLVHPFSHYGTDRKSSRGLGGGRFIEHTPCFSLLSVEGTSARDVSSRDFSPNHRHFLFASQN
jgi:hypothetical protein